MPIVSREFVIELQTPFERRLKYNIKSYYKWGKQRAVNGLITYF